MADTPLSRAGSLLQVFVVKPDGSQQNLDNGKIPALPRSPFAAPCRLKPIPCLSNSVLTSSPWPFWPLSLSLPASSTPSPVVADS
ncbi:hypothetical protein DKY63_05240 [Pseudomonas putida]|uniref:Uncharacterized protein n=1 Tax=Pseudomonas putida TaxID=303 RepID=A0A2Z4RDX8_PSEPU|nr:hypothetical protein DKY63_05240 [Pseudomonas putida]